MYHLRQKPKYGSIFSIQAKVPKEGLTFFLLLLLTQLKNLNPVSTTLSSMDLEILKPKGRMLLPNTTMVQGIWMLQPLLAILFLYNGKPTFREFTVQRD